MAKETRDYHQGLLYPDPRITFWEAESTITESGARADQPEPDQASQLSLRASGTPTYSGTTTLEVRTQEGGLPNADGGASFVWRQSDDAATEYRGQDLPVFVSHYEVVNAASSAVGLSETKRPHAITLTNDKIACAVQVRHGSSHPSRANEYSVNVFVRDTAGAWTIKQVWSYGTSAPPHPFYPTICQLESGRLVVFHYEYDTTTGTAQVRSWYSDDDGDSWGQLGRACLPEPVVYGTDVPKWMRCAAYRGGVILLVDLEDSSRTPAAHIRQYASANPGGVFRLITESPVTSDHAHACGTALVNADVLHVFYGADASANLGYHHRLGSVFDPIPWMEATAVGAIGANFGAQFNTFLVYSGSPYTVTNRDLAVAGSPDGRLWAYVRDQSGGGNDQQCYVAAVSYDNGLSWNKYERGSGSGLPVITDFGDTGTHPRHFTTVWQRGRVVMLTNHDSTPATRDDALCGLYLGGWSQVNLPEATTARSLERAVTFNRGWLPWDLPTDTGWTGGGTRTESITTDIDLSLSTTATAGYYEKNPTTTKAEGIIVLAEFQVDSGGGSGNGVGFRIRLDDSGNDVDVSVLCSTTNIYLRDEIAASQLASAAVDTTVGIQVLFAAAGTKVSVWYRAYDSDDDREWTALVTNQTASTGAAATADLIRWGHIGSQTSTSTWYSIGYATSSSVGVQMTNPTNPDDLRGAPYSPLPVYAGKGISVASSGGMAGGGETFQVPARADYDIAHVLTPSPRQEWRATGTAQTKIAFQWDADADNFYPHALLGIYLGNTNATKVSIEGYDEGTTSWVNIDTGHLYVPESSTLDITRGGSVVVNDPSASVSNPFFYENELAGWAMSLDLDGSGGTARRISWNSGGTFNSGNTGARCIVHLNDVDDGADPSTSTTAAIFPTDHVLVVGIDGAAYSGIRIVIETPGASCYAPPESYWKCGRILVGPVFAFSQLPDWGRTIEQQTNEVIETLNDGTRRSHVAGPPRRVASFSWMDGIETTPAVDPTGVLEPDAMEISGFTRTLTPIGSLPFDLAGILRVTDGGHLPVVYVPRISASLSTGGTQVLNRRDDFIYGRIVSAVTHEVAQGDESDTEVIRIPTITLEEEL